MTEQGKLNY